MKRLPKLNPVIHEASRLSVLAVLNECEEADFNFLLTTLGFSRGNLSVHMRKLVTAEYVKEKKEFIERKPLTCYRLSSAGRLAYKNYLKDLKKITGI